MDHTTKPSVLYLYAGTRKSFYEQYKKGLVPDTQLLGLNYMNEFGISARFLEWPISNWLRRVNFNLVHVPYIFAIRRYDVVFICAGLPLVFLARWLLCWKRPKFVMYNTSLVNALKRNERGLLHFIITRAIRNIDAIVCTSLAQKDFLRKRGFKEENILYHPIGIDA
ncbi:MAG: glycosyltransferase, partial [bacterium]|nr:glycosyltransferase [bacterium]